MDSIRKVLQPISLDKVKLSDKFWAPRIEKNQKITIPHVFKQLENTGHIKNFLRAAGILNDGKRPIFPHEDSDVYKAIEGAAISLRLNPDSKLETYIERHIEKIKKAQENDGYLYTTRTISPEKPHIWAGNNRWELVSVFSHELYNLGHLIESAIAHYQATGKHNLLNVAIKSADLIEKEFGYGKIERFPGHQEIEIGLLKLYKITTNKKYLDLAKFFLDIRGSSDSAEFKNYLLKFDSEFPFPSAKSLLYNQTHKKIIEQDEAVGHVVRALYMYSAVTEIIDILNDKEYQSAIDRVWNNIIKKKLYITGGLGARKFAYGEGFGDNYTLPNFDSYCETCAAIANVFWNHRLFLLYGDAKYIDILERSLYNAVLAGISLDGKFFFYDNPLATNKKVKRKPWFRVPCCPTNIVRLLPQIPSYLYAMKDDTVYVNLFATSQVNILLEGSKIVLKQDTNYPWEGDIKISIKTKQKKEFVIALRIPSWAQNKPISSDLYRYLKNNPENIILKINKDQIDFKVEKGFIKINKVWEQEDVIELKIPMPIRRVLANRQVEVNIGKVAIERGPIVFCVESLDNEIDSIFKLILNDEDKLRAVYREDLLDGICFITGKVNFIPYYSWANRGKSEMTVWIPRYS
ncbi:MAG: glycoside hydrolase family 127 protein [Promethearchaeota archaeon]